MKPLNSVSGFQTCLMVEQFLGFHMEGPFSETQCAGWIKWELHFLEVRRRQGQESTHLIVPSPTLTSLGLLGSTQFGNLDESLAAPYYQEMALLLYF